MLLPIGLLKVHEYDAVFTITPTSKFSHNSDTVLASIEMLIENDQAESIEFPFAVLNTDSGLGESVDEKSVVPHVTNGSRDVAVQKDDSNREQLLQSIMNQIRTAGVTDATKLAEAESYWREVLKKAKRSFVGRTKIKSGEKRRIILQQRLRVLPAADGSYTFETIAPSPIAILATGGRVSVVTLMPWKDDDVKPEITELTQGFELERGMIKQRDWAAWHWRNDPVFKVVYKYS